MSVTETVPELLDPLWQALRAGAYVRLLARPHWVWLERTDGALQATVPWDEERHIEAQALIGEGLRLPDGCCAVCTGDVLVLSAPPNPHLRVDELAQQGLVSPLAGRTLSAAVALGRNVVVVGPAVVASALASALLAEGRRPCVVAPRFWAVPPTWPRFDATIQAQLFGADRIGCLGLDVDSALAVLSEATGVVACLDARRLDRALIRCEASISRRYGAVPTPLHLLAALDVVAVVTDNGGARVTEVAEIELAEDGYRPRLLFACGLPPMPSALVPLAPPSFVDELAQAGMGVLADELRHATPQQASLPSRPAIERAAPAVPQAGSAKVESSAPLPPEPAASPMSDTPPGWELDQLGDEVAANDTEGGSAEDATLAAAYGLAPPPRPASLRGERPNFEEALRRAQEREAAERDSGE